jgi:hypothetical protein
MDEWLFISLAKAKADAPRAVKKADSAPAKVALTKADTAQALDVSAAFERPVVRGVAALLGAALINTVLLGAIEGTAVDARTPKGEVVVAQLDTSEELSLRAQASAYEPPAAF